MFGLSKGERATPLSHANRLQIVYTVHKQIAPNAHNLLHCENDFGSTMDWHA